jgi:hypothetical protein
MPRQTIPLTAFTVCDTEPGADIDEVRLPPLIVVAGQIRTDLSHSAELFELRIICA